MPTFNWREFLSLWSKELLESGYYRELPADVISSGWLGYPGATETQIKQVETRLGIVLPFSYQEFLKTSNGWRKPSLEIERLWPTEEINWFYVRNKAWIEEWNAHKQDLDVLDDEYFVYGEGQSDLSIRVEYLQTALEISGVGDHTVYLLNPKIVTPEGEWEAWILSAWGVTRYRSFQEMMQAEYKHFQEWLILEKNRLPDE